ncbi:MAG: PEP/pyruvate-binding domain-containing protein [Parachlamydiaceae bacterium]
MTNVSKFVKEYVPLCVCTLGIAILGYLGYHAVRWIINKCQKTEKVDQVAQKNLGVSLERNSSTPSNTLPENNPLSKISHSIPLISEEASEEEIPLREVSEDQKKLAAVKIQNAYRGHVARLALKKLQIEKLEKEKSKAAVRIQSIWRGYSTRFKAEKAGKIATHDHVRLGPAEPSVSYKKRAGLHSCGNKYDGLVSVKMALRKKTAQVPFFFGFTDRQILSLLSDSTLDLWCKVGKAAKGSSFALRGIDFLLSQLQSSIRTDILNGEFPFSALQIEALAICENKKLIVRSSSNEDTLAVINAGGNASVGGISPEVEAIKEAVAEVVSSYFSYPSLKNRSAFEDPFKDLPLCSVLVMEQIDDSSEDEPVVSGVMMTHKPSWISGNESTIPHIAASWGFGQGVVSGKVPSDEWVLTDGVTYATIRNKSHRLVIGQGGNVSERANPVSLRKRPVLNEQQILQLRIAAQEIEEFFKKPMDVEFVFQKERLYIVQARPIQTQEIKSPTFIDSSVIPGHIPRFCAKTILPGLGEVISVAPDQILFESDLEHAELSYNPSTHRAVILFKEPESANTHAEVNLASQSPPVLCFVLSKEEWMRCRDMLNPSWSSQRKDSVKICPQTGLLVITGMDLPIRKGLVVHPAQFPISVASAGQGLQGSSSHAKIVRLRELITTTSEQIESHLPEAEKTLDDCFVEILSRSTCLGSFRETAEKLQVCTTKIFRAMQQAAVERKPTLVSFHATALRQVLGQVAPQIIGAHSLSGLEAATNIAPQIEDFLREFQHQKTLCELAMVGRKAFDESIQTKWIAFLREHSAATSEATWGTLLSQVKKFDAMDQMSLWFSFHLKGAELPQIDALIEQNRAMEGFFSSCADFIEKLRLLSEATVRAETVHELDKAWKGLEAVSKAVLSFCAECPKQNLLQTLQISHLLYELIQLWDLNIKTAQTSKIDPQISDSKAMRDRIFAFAEFGKMLVSKDLVNVSGNHKHELMRVFREVFYDSARGSRQFFLQHWLVPRGVVNVPIRTNDQRLTVIHQNLLKAIGPNFSDIAPILPSALASAVETFRATHSDITKRFGEHKGIFAMMTDRSASVVINIPLNYHSFVLTIRQNTGSEKLEFTAEWRGSDNWQGAHLSFFEALADLSDLTVQSSFTVDSDLRIVFAVCGKSQIEMLSKAIFHVNIGTLYYQDYFGTLAILLHLRKLEGKTWQDKKLERRETEEGILDHIWKRFEETGEINAVFQRALEDHADVTYLEKRRLLPKVIEQMSSELEGRVAGKKYLELFADSVLASLPLERRKELFWSNLIGPQLVIFTVAFPDELKGEMLARLQEEAPEKFEKYCLKDSFAKSNLKEFQDLADKKD